MSPPAGYIFIGPYVVPRAAPIAIIPMVSDIQRKVAAYYRLPLIEMTSARRSRDVARPRQIAMYLSRQLTLRSLPDIGRRFGGRDHTTVIHAIRQIEALRTSDADLDQDIRNLTTNIAA
jgi:chromosomal replication initiator protein